MQKGRFRADLYHRLNVVRLRIPSLRERKADVPLLISHYASKFQQDGSRAHFSRDSMQVLTDYPWPGNVRELRNMVEATLLTGPQLIEPRHLPLAMRCDSEPRRGQVAMVKSNALPQDGKVRTHLTV